MCSKNKVSPSITRYRGMAAQFTLTDLQRSCEEVRVICKKLMENIAIRKQYSPLYLLTLRLICHALPEPDASLTDVARPELNRLCLLPERVSCLFLFPERDSVSSELWVLRSRQHLPVMVRGNVSFNVCAFMFGWLYYLCGACSEFPPILPTLLLLCNLAHSGFTGQSVVLLLLLSLKP